MQTGRDLRRSLIQSSAVIRPSFSVFLGKWVLGISGDCTVSLIDHLHEAEKASQFNWVYSEYQFSELVPTAPCCPLVHCRVLGFILPVLEGSWVVPNHFSWGAMSPAPSSSPHRKNIPALNNPGGPLLISLEFGIPYIGVPKMHALLKCMISSICLKSTFPATGKSSNFQFFAHNTRAGLYSTNKSMPKMPLYLFLTKSILYKSVCEKRHCVPQPLVNFSCIQTTIYDLKAFST